MKYRLTSVPETEIPFTCTDCQDCFNMITLSYSSSHPSLIRLHYLCDGQSVSDPFFLEAGEHTFRGLIMSYLDGKTASCIQSITAVPLIGDVCDLEIKNISVAVYPIFDNVIYYLENSRYRIGIQLLWGGGICSVRDKLMPVSDSFDSVTNLINHFDTGRLIQQSYYGTRGNDEYTSGEFMGNRWSYNPVQGGDKMNNHSRLIDIRTSDDSIFIKSQPQDWSLDGMITPSYMENTYTLTDSFIRVDNRFTDFSGWEHPISSQELPAFYTISWLDTFVMYEGSRPWTGGELTYLPDLPFWPTDKICRRVIRESNSEIWSAWINSDEKWGIGLFVPETDIIFTGRYEFNGTKDPLASPTNYTAPLCSIRLVSHKPLEYSYLIASGSIDEIRQVFSDNRNLIDNSFLRENKVSSRRTDAD